MPPRDPIRPAAPARLSLLTDGPTDKALEPILQWLLRQCSTRAFEVIWADLSVGRRLHRPKLAERVKKALSLYPCDLLVVHRDAEREPPEKREQEIEEATKDLNVPVAAAIPVRMIEAWLLFDEAAIRWASGCPNGRVPLSLPALKAVESIADPKESLHGALRSASQLPARRLKHFRPDIRRVAELVEDFAPLRALPAFVAFEASLCGALATLGVLRAPTSGGGGHE